MMNKSKTLRALTALVLTAAFALPAFADTLKLKDGSIIKGRIVSFGDGKFTILIGSGSRQRQMVFFADEVESIEFDGIGPTVARANAPSYNDASAGRAAESTVITTGGGQSSVPAPTPKPTPVSNTAPAVVVTNNPIPAPTPKSTPAPTPATQNTAGAPGVIINVKVLADNTSNGWSNAGVVVRKGQRIRISATGRISLGPGKNSSAAGVPSIADKDKLMSNEPTGGLIAVIGDDNNDFIFIGASKDFTATRDGALFLGVNEGVLDDNTGSFDVSIEIDPRQ